MDSDLFTEAAHIMADRVWPQESADIFEVPEAEQEIGERPQRSFSCCWAIQQAASEAGLRRVEFERLRQWFLDLFEPEPEDARDGKHYTWDRYDSESRITALLLAAEIANNAKPCNDRLL
jgi:hypothetical protein